MFYFEIIANSHVVIGNNRDPACPLLSFHPVEISYKARRQFHSERVSVHSDCSDKKYHRLGGLNNKLCWVPGRPRSRHWQIWYLARISFLVHGRLSCCVLTWRNRQGSSLESLIRALVPFMRAPPLWPNNLPKDPPPDIMGIRFQHMNLGGWGSKLLICCTGIDTVKIQNMCIPWRIPLIALSGPPYLPFCHISFLISDSHSSVLYFYKHLKK